MTTVVETLQAGDSPLGDPARTGEATTDVGRARWRLYGGAGPVVLLVDAPDDLSGWPPAFVTAILSRGMRVLVYGTDAPAPVAPGIGAAVALDVLDAAGVDKVHLVGCSAGGLTAQAVLARQPARVASLCLMMTRLAAASPRSVEPGLLERLASGRRPPTGAAVRSSAITRHSAALALVGSGFPGQRARARRRATDAVRCGADPVGALLSFAAGQDDLVVPTGPVDVPVTVVHGRHDPVLRAGDADDLVARYGADLVVLPTAHDLPWGFEEEVAESIEALRLRASSGPRPAAGSHRPRWGLRLGIAAAIVAVLAVVSLIAASTITVPYYAIRPGSARPTNDLVVVPPEKRITPTGQVLFVTVGVQPLRALQYVLAKRDPDVDVVPEEAILGKSNPKEYRQRSTQAMVSSKEAAAVVALQRLCLPVKEKGTGARIEQTVAGSPADQAGLKADDTIVAIGGTPVTTADQALQPLRALKPGSPFSLTVIGPVEGDQERTVAGTLGANPTDANRSFLGVALRTRAQDFDLPFELGVESGRVGGPSAGLAFTLALLDQLTPGELTGGGKVAATGTIELDGSVGLVGGVPQKAVAVRRSGARLFIVPSAELAEARSKVGRSVEVVPADDLEQAIDALRTHGGDVSGIPTSCPGS